MTDATGPAELLALIRDIPDFPEPGVVFKDITPLLADHGAFTSCVDVMVEAQRHHRIDKVVGTEARGFILAAPIAQALGAGFVPVRKPGKLPWAVERWSYELEYGSGVLEVHQDAVVPGERVLVVDDVLATGGTAAASAKLVEQLGGEVVGFSFLMELLFLDGRTALGDLPVDALLAYR